MTKRGGARPGAGRKPVPAHLKKRQVGIQLPEWMITKLDKLSGKRQALIEQAIIDKYKWKAPK